MIAFSRKLWEPRPFARSLSWFREFVYTHEGKPFDHNSYPHFGAPGGPCDALDDPHVLTIWLQWGSRLGKTFFGQCASMFYADTNPRPEMFASADKKLALEVVDRTYRMVERCSSLRDQLLPPHQRRQDLIKFDSCRMYVAWARSVSSLADKAVRFGHANEIDKWEHLSTSKEADPLKLFTDRFKEFHSHKKICESTPSIKGRSRVEAGRLASSNCLFHVPCPHCGRYQVLKMERIKWDKDENGKSDKDVARRTAYYQCDNVSCTEPILDEHRIPMLRLGVWVPEGCGVDDEKAREAANQWADIDTSPWGGWSTADWITGTPKRDGPDAGYQLSSLYAWSLGWGEIAAEFVSSQAAQNLRNFINQWLSETWELRAREQTWEQLGGRLINDVPPGIVPEGFHMLTFGGDQQEDRSVYVVDAWDGEGRSHTIAYGECENRDDLIDTVLTRIFDTQAGGKMMICYGLFDSGFRSSQIYDFCLTCCRRGVPILACKGWNAALGSPFVVAMLGQDTARPGTPYIKVDTITTQDWIERQLHDIKPGEAGSASLYSASLVQHQEFLEQLLNETSAVTLDSKNYARESWNRITTDIPNDYRDARRYSYVAGLIAMAGGIKGLPPGNTSAAVVRPVPVARPRQESSSGGWEVSL
jgi:phage terminase large subunit GpA-like protein